jgi:hypothetical protein
LPTFSDIATKTQASTTLVGSGTAKLILRRLKAVFGGCRVTTERII